MKKVALLGITFLCCFLSIQLSAQDARPEVTNEDLEVKKYTVMEKFEPDLVLSVNERVRLKKERLAAIERRRGILDT
ncbi:MAG: hypothetical protein KJO63_01910, partial [Maribacter sp.]|nr:hypothetical protein [Maribacter sp.]